jgi:hypothetical protein
MLFSVSPAARVERVLVIGLSALRYLRKPKPKLVGDRRKLPVASHLESVASLVSLEPEPRRG